jgi:hypothetical protein
MYSKPEIQNKTISSAYKRKFLPNPTGISGSATLELSERSTQRGANHQTAQRFRYLRLDRQARS